MCHMSRSPSMGRWESHHLPFPLIEAARGAANTKYAVVNVYPLECRTLFGGREEGVRTLVLRARVARGTTELVGRPCSLHRPRFDDPIDQ